MKKYNIPEIKITNTLTISNIICNDGSAGWEWTDIPELKEDN